MYWSAFKVSNNPNIFRRNSINEFPLLSIMASTALFYLNVTFLRTLWLRESNRTRSCWNFSDTWSNFGLPVHFQFTRAAFSFLAAIVRWKFRLLRSCREENFESYFRNNGGWWKLFGRRLFHEVKLGFIQSTVQPVCTTTKNYRLSKGYHLQPCTSCCQEKLNPPLPFEVESSKQRTSVGNFSWKLLHWWTTSTRLGRKVYSFWKKCADGSSIVWCWWVCACGGCELWAARVVTFTNVEVERSASCGGCCSALCCWKKAGNGTEPGRQKIRKLKMAPIWSITKI